MAWSLRDSSLDLWKREYLLEMKDDRQTDVHRPYFPGALFLLSSWYTRRELATRTAVLYTGSLLSSGFGGLVGAGVQYGLDGAHGLESWRWLFIIEGSVTVAFALTCM
jgi:hypothetical protein